MHIFNVSIFSIFSSILFFNIAVLIIISCRKKTDFIINHGINLLLLSTLLAFIRLILPIDLYSSKIIDIDYIYTLLKYFLLLKIGNLLFVYQLLLLLWGTGTILFLFYYLFISIREIYRLNHSCCVTCPALDALCSHYTSPQLILRVSTDIDTPRVWGFHKCHIYFPDYTLSPDEWRLILEHEIQHIKSHDTLIKILFLFLSALFWWNPIMYTLQKNIDQMLELRCDAKLTKYYSSEKQNKYLQTILKVLKQKNLAKMPKSCLTASFVSYSAYALTRQRFELVLNNKHSSKLKTLLCYGIVLLLFVGSYFIILQPNKRMTSEPGPSLILHTPENKYELHIDGKLYKTLTSKEAHSKKYSKYELIEGNN